MPIHGEKIRARRDPSMPKGRQLDDLSHKEVLAVIGKLPIQRDLLIEALHLLQDNFGCLEFRHLRSLAEIFSISQAEVYEVASFYHHFDIIGDRQGRPPPITVRICDGLSCEMDGANSLISDLEKELDPSKVRIQKVPCIGRCANAPAAQVGKRAVDHASTEKIIRALEGSVDPIIPNYQSLNDYISKGGYSCLENIIGGKLSFDQVISILEKSGLRGLGGAGFPASKKWQFVHGYDEPRLMTINGDEGEPGTFKDRYWLESQPHKMLEGAQIAAQLVGCNKIYLYMRDEYPAVLEILRIEIGKLELKPFWKVPIEVRRGAGAYICGEESAMIESIEGKRGLPRHKPPYIAENGLFGMPTLNHNIETLLWIPDILSKGSKWFSTQGISIKHAGIRSFSVSGRVANPGVKVAPAGISVNQLIDNFCGGMKSGHVFKAFFPGGASGGIFPAEMANLPLDFGTFEPFGGFVGSHAVIILSSQDSILDAVINTIKFFKHESCGQCTPCRNGTEKLIALLSNRSKDINLYNDLMFVMTDSSICGLGQAATNCLKHMLKYFSEDLNGAR
jgi:NADH:ubiquinone oxidoreductase subunit F (NADH-binding)/NADH:ubiquinone oxidoreductase subunit E